MKQTATLIFAMFLPVILFAQNETAPAKLRMSCRTGMMSLPPPVYVLDGELVDSAKIRQLNPNDIASIAILKDTTAIALYGSSGINGVIVITSKSSMQRQFLVLDMLDGDAIAGAYVDFVDEANDSDTLRFIADGKGRIGTDVLKPRHSYKVLISSAGYTLKTFSYRNERKDAVQDFLLERNVVSMSNVTIRGYGPVVCRRIISCGWIIKENSATAPAGAQNEQSATGRVYPNPLQRGSSVTVEFMNTNDQKMDMRLFSLSGQSMRRNVVQLNKGVNRISVNTGTDWPAGSYIVQLVDQQGKIRLQQKLIVE